MVKSRKILLIVLSVLLVFAVAAFVVLALVDFKFSNIGGGKAEKNTVNILNSYTTIEVEEVAGAVNIVFAGSGEKRVEGYKKGGIYTEVIGSSTTSTLKISVVDERKWYEKVFVDTSDMVVTVYLPEYEYQLIKVKTVSGNIDVDDKFDCETVKLSSVSGNIESDAIASENLNVSSTSGNVSLNGYDHGDVNAKTVSGKLTLTKFSAKSVTAKTTSGALDLDDVIAEESINAESVSGKITFKYADGEEMTFLTVSGSVDGEIIESKKIKTSTVSGKVDVPKSYDNENPLSITTTSGNITVKYYGIN